MKHTILLSALLLGLASCSKHRLHGEGDTITDNRDLSSFSKIEMSGSEDVEVLYGPERRAEVTGYRNLVSEYETEVSGSTLRLRFEDEYWNVRHNNIHVRIYTPSVSEVIATGSGKLSVLSNGALGLRKAEVTGSGDLEISQPEVTALHLRVTGSGKLKARAAAAEDVEAEVTGSGDIETTANENLDAEITGSGDIEYWGGARVNTQVTGSGRVRGH